ncbi:MAG TPA: bis-aminopropyl spermidine synthase family protein [Micromonosporaceae bacterium]
MDARDVVRALLREAGIAGRRLRTALRLLIEGPHTLASLVLNSGVDRRTVERLVAALGDDLATTGDHVIIAPQRIEAYRELIDYPRLVETEPADPLGQRLAAHVDLVERVQTWISGAPRARQALDHVPATAQTVVRRALWLDATFDLDEARLLCVGDHDLTSLAVARVNPRVTVTVVDVDDALLAYIDAQNCPSIRCLWSDLRFGLASGATGWADLVVTDPPYTPEGVGLFLSRGLQGLRHVERARLVMAYGFAENHPGLGRNVQQAVTGLRLVYEAILPGFNRYHGAQAIASRSDLYVLRPTSRTAPSADVRNIYTHGAQSLEAEVPLLAAEVAQAVWVSAAGASGLPVTVVGPGWPAPSRALASVLGGQPPAAATGTGVAASLSGDPGGWLVRLLLAVDAPRVAVLVDNNHPDLANQAAQRGLAEAVGSRYRLRFRRSTPDPRHAIVEADRIDIAELGGAQRVVRGVIDRAQGKVGNTWREALIRAAADDGATLTKNDARAHIRAAVPVPALLDEPLIGLPRHRIAELLRVIATTPLPDDRGRNRVS